MAQQGSSRRRAERLAVSCSECRRRKQKCNQRRPCSNCSRRFPPPICEYKGEHPASRDGPLFMPTELIEAAELKDGVYPCVAALSQAENSQKKFDVNDSALIYDPQKTNGYDASRAAEPASWAFRMTLNNMCTNERPDPPFEPLFHNLDNRATTPPESDDDEDYARPAEYRHWLTDLQVLSRFKVSLDGNPEAGNPFMKLYVPFCLQDPLLLQVTLCTTSSFFAETQKIPRTVPMLHKGATIYMLNQLLRTETHQISDQTVLGVSTMVLHSWYWADTRDILTHINGLKQMIRLRGGLNKLGLHGYLAKSILTHDAAMSLAHEVEPIIYGQPGFEYHENVMIPFRMLLNSPFLPSWPSFTSAADTLKLPSPVASILDEMRGILKAVLALPMYPSDEEMEKVRLLALALNLRLLEMPASISTEPEQPLSPPRTPETEDETYRSGSSSTEDELSLSKKVDRPDCMYRTVRMTAKVYCKAILDRTPTSTVLSASEFAALWPIVWQAGLSTWARALGVFIWVLIGIMPSCHKSAEARFIKSFMMASFMCMGVENWHFGLDVVNAGLGFQCWLSRNRRPRADDPKRGLSGSRSIVDKYGFPIKENLPKIELDEETIQNES